MLFVSCSWTFRTNTNKLRGFGVRLCSVCSLCSWTFVNNLFVRQHWSAPWWSVHLANKQSAHYMEHSIMERSIIHSIIHLKPPDIISCKIIISLASRWGKWVSFQRLEVVYPFSCQKSAFFSENLWAKQVINLDFLPWKCFSKVGNSARCLFSLF